MTKFESGRSGRGGAYLADPSGSPHAKFMRLSAYALAPLGVFAAWFLAGVAGKSYDAARAELGRPFPAIVLIAFIALGMLHAAAGAEAIIEDYVHDEALKQKALLANKWASRAIVAIWTLAIMLIAAPK